MIARLMSANFERINEAIKLAKRAAYTIDSTPLDAEYLSCVWRSKSFSELKNIDFWVYFAIDYFLEIISEIDRNFYIIQIKSNPITVHLTSENKEIHELCRYFENKVLQS